MRFAVLAPHHLASVVNWRYKGLAPMVSPTNALRRVFKVWKPKKRSGSAEGGTHSNRTSSTLLSPPATPASSSAPSSSSSSSPSSPPVSVYANSAIKSVSSSSSITLSNEFPTSPSAPQKLDPVLQLELSKLTGQIKGTLPQSYNSIELPGSSATDVRRGEWIPEGTEKSQFVVIKSWRINQGDGDCYPRAVRRMVREVRDWQGLHHPNILPLLGWKIEGPIWCQPCIVTPYCKAGDLAHLLKPTPPKETPSNAERLRLVLQVGKTIAYLHALSPPAVHGNIDASNVLISDTGDALLSDFGSARVASAGKTGLTTEGALQGSARYQAPELYSQTVEDHDSAIPASDVYSFGCLVLHILSGVPPFPNVKKPRFIHERVCKGETSVRKDHLPVLTESAAVWELLGRCWNLDPTQRPTMPDVLKWLAEHEAYAPVTA
ncbi:hypothetical protein FRB95_002617 [Tulasnella sp. JGI-2019a]|nr:hypothetical protein FRB95_002617 [Tulasnella sp. JGI-2019a]